MLLLPGLHTVAATCADPLLLALLVPPPAQITWPDGFSQIASYELLDSLPRLAPEEAAARQQQRAAAAAAAGSGGGLSAAQQILQSARSVPPS